MADEDLDNHPTPAEVEIHREYRDVLPMFRFIVETQRRFYLANHADVVTRSLDGSPYFEVDLRDVWVWDPFRPARFVDRAKVMTFRDVNVELLPNADLVP